MDLLGGWRLQLAGWKTTKVCVCRTWFIKGRNFGEIFVVRLLKWIVVLELISGAGGTPNLWVFFKGVPWLYLCPHLNGVSLDAQRNSPFLQKKMVVNDMLKQLFFTHRLHLNVFFFSDTEMAISGQQRSDSSVWRKRRDTGDLVEFTQPASPTMVRATGVCVLAAATRRKTRARARDFFRPNTKWPIWSKYIQIQRTTSPPLKSLQEEFFLKKKVFNPPPVFFSNGFFFKKLFQPPPHKNTHLGVCFPPEALCLLRSIAFVPTPSRSTAADPAVAASAAVLATVPVGADAFVFKGYLELWGVGRWKRIHTYVYIYMYIYIYLDLPKGAKWFLKGVNSPSLRV